MAEKNGADLRAALATCVEEMKSNNSMAIRGTIKDTIATSVILNEITSPLWTHLTIANRKEVLLLSSMMKDFYSENMATA